MHGVLQSTKKSVKTYSLCMCGNDKSNSNTDLPRIWFQVWITHNYFRWKRMQHHTFVRMCNRYKSVSHEWWNNPWKKLYLHFRKSNQKCKKLGIYLKLILLIVLLSTNYDSQAHWLLFGLLYSGSCALPGSSRQREMFSLHTAILLQHSQQDVWGVHLHRLWRKQQQLCLAAELHGRVC